MRRTKVKMRFEAGKDGGNQGQRGRSQPAHHHPDPESDRRGGAAPQFSGQEARLPPITTSRYQARPALRTS